MSSSGLDAYAIVVAVQPEPPEDPDPQQVARETQQALFSQEQSGSAWTAPLSPARPGRQRLPVPPEDRGPLGDTIGTERSAMCILGPEGGHVSRGLHCPHNLPEPGQQDSIIRVEF